VRVPRTAAEWDAETDVIRLARSYRGRRWFPRLRLFAVACCRRVWDQVPPGPPRDAVEVAERFAYGMVGKSELWTAHSAAYSAVREAVRISETRYIYGTLAEARPSVAWACTLPAEHPGHTVPMWVQLIVGLLRYEAAVGAGAAWREAEAASHEAESAEQSALTALLREMVGNPFVMPR
jgi:hypothetical protein